MHEYSIVMSLIDRVQAEAQQRGAKAVTRLFVEIGELSGVDTELLTTAYETFRESTICADASLDLRAVPARWACSRCGLRIEPGSVLSCPACEVPATLQSGDEILLRRIEMEVSDV